MSLKDSETTLEERNIVINLFKEGNSYSNIAAIVKKSCSIVQSVINSTKTVQSV